MTDISVEEKFAYYERTSPGKYILLAGKIVSVEWANKHPEKFMELYKK